MWQICICCMFHHSLHGGIWKLLLPENVLRASEGQGKVPRTTVCLWNKGGHMSENWLTNWKQAVTCTSHITSRNTSPDRRCAEGLLCCYVICRHIQNWIYEGWNFNSGNYLFTTDTISLSVCPAYCVVRIVVARKGNIPYFSYWQMSIV